MLSPVTTAFAQVDQMQISQVLRSAVKRAHLGGKTGGRYESVASAGPMSAATA